MTSPSCLTPALQRSKKRINQKTKTWFWWIQLKLKKPRNRPSLNKKNRKRKSLKTKKTYKRLSVKKYQRTFSTESSNP